MSVALLIMAAAGAQTATPAEYSAPRSSQEDAIALNRLYPSTALRDDESAAALMDIEVDPEGRVLKCETIAIYGSRPLGERICELQKKARVTPARIGGAPAYGAYRGFAAFYLPGNKLGRKVAAMRPVASAEFAVANLPDGKDTLRLGLTMMIAPDGAVSRCRGGDDQYPTFVSAACDEIAKVRFVPVTDTEGKPVQHVRGFTVEFSLAK
jgi:hypothetical protein